MSQTSSTPVDAKAFYGYLFETNKQPTKVLDALLRGIANHIRDSIGSKDERKLTPEKLASFYKAVGGNYDSLFVDVPHPSISWIYASIGCQHTLQPTADDFVLPSVPALTTRGFVRWQSIEILLGPEEHVPFIQYAVKNFAIKNPETGETFPTDLPAEAFPQVADADIERWHNECAEKLRQQSETTSPKPPPRPKVSSYVHVRPPRPSPRDEAEYPRPTTRVEVEPDFYEARNVTRPFVYKHVDPNRPERPILSRSPSHRARQFLAPEDSPRLSRSRRRSYPENLGSPITTPPIPDGRPPSDPEHVRRHSHPRRRRGSVSSDASSEDDSRPPSPVSPVHPVRRRAKTHSQSRSQDIPPVSVRYMTPATAPQVSIPTFPDPPRPRTRERRSSRDRDRDREEEKRKGFPIPIDITGKLSAPFLLGKRTGTRDSSRNGNVRWKDLNPADLWRRPSRSEEEVERPRRGSREERDSREHKRRDRDRDRDARPRMETRRSSHEDVLRRDRDLERERDREPVSGRSDRRSFRERDRERRYASPIDDRERRHVSPIRGVDGRRYPSHSG